MKTANTILHDFCTNCVKTEEHVWLQNEASVVHQVMRICEHADTRREMETLAAACRLYMEADKKMTPRWLKRLYKQIAIFLTRAGVPTDYCPDSEHKVQSGATSLAIAEGICVIFAYRKPVASVRLTYPELWACMLRRLMLS